MSKRFTDTDIWKQRWFRILKPVYKEFWRFLCENCNLAGIWEIDIEQASFMVNENIDFEDFLKVINSDKYRIHLLPKNKLWILQFISFQQGHLSEDCRPHKMIIDLLKQESLWDNEKHSPIEINVSMLESDNSFNTLNKGYDIPLTKGIGKGMGKGSSNSNSNSNSNSIINTNSIKEKEIDKEKEKPLSQPTPQLEAQTDLFADSNKMVEHIGKANEMVIPEQGSKPEKKKSKSTPPYEEIINYLNEKSGKKFRPQSKPTQEAVNARFSEGFTLEDFKHVIKIKSEQWRNDPQMNKYLCPETLFRPSNFEKYLNEVSESELALADEFAGYGRIEVPDDFMRDGKSDLLVMREEIDQRLKDQGVTQEQIDKLREY